jgi:hypothetical protein
VKGDPVTVENAGSAEATATVDDRHNPPIQAITVPNPMTIRPSAAVPDSRPIDVRPVAEAGVPAGCSRAHQATRSILPKRTCFR